MNSIRASLIVLGMLVLALPAGCATAPEKSVDPEASLRKTAELYWTKRLIDGDYGFTYELELERDSMPFSEYRAKAAGKFRCISVETRKVVVEGEEGLVYIAVECMMPFLQKSYKQTISDRWVYRSGGWRHRFLTESR